MISGHGGNTHEVKRQLGCSTSEIIDMSSNMNPLGPFPGLMEQAGRINAFIENTQRFLDSEMRFLNEAFDGATGIKLFPSTTSYILAQLTGARTAESVLAAMLEHRILLRNCSNFIGLSDRYIRISLKKHPVNALLAKTLKQAVSATSLPVHRKVG